MDIKDKKLRFCIVCDDRTVYVNGDPRVLDADVEVPAGVHAIQWYGTWGEIEYKTDADGKKPENEKFFDPSHFEEWFDGHLNAVKRDEAKVAEEDAARKRAEEARIAEREVANKVNEDSLNAEIDKRVKKLLKEELRGTKA